MVDLYLTCGLKRVFDARSSAFGVQIGHICRSRQQGRKYGSQRALVGRKLLGGFACTADNVAKFSQKDRTLDGPLDKHRSAIVFIDFAFNHAQ
jgi:hypothetical protein